MGKYLRILDYPAHEEAFREFIRADKAGSQCVNRRAIVRKKIRVCTNPDGDIRHGTKDSPEKKK